MSSPGELSITSYAPVINQAASSFKERLKPEKEVFASTAGIGYDTASFTLTGPLDYLQEWFSKGLVRDVIWRDPEGGTCWNGYVNRLGLTAGGETRTRTVDDMYNRIIFIYTPLDTTNNPPTAGAQTTITKNDTASQDKYGIKTILKSGGEMTAATADDAALCELTKNAYIAEGRAGTVGTGKVPSLKVQMRGYAYMANWNVYTQTGSSGTSNANTIISLVLAADPNSVMSTSAINIDACTTAVEQYWDGKQLSWKIIQDIANRGYETGGAGFQWTIGVYEDRRTHYKQAESVDSNGVALSTNKYLPLHRMLFDPGDSILDDASREVKPWALRPDRLLYTEGFPGRPTYIIKVTFTAPFKVAYEGTDVQNPVARYLSGGCK